MKKNFHIKRLYGYILKTFIPLFLMTFAICLFLVLMQFLWKYVEDMVGKGLGIGLLGELFVVAALNLVPMALPLAILLASLMAFGNLGENLELLAIKSAGIPLLKTMKPLIILVFFISVGAFFYQNNAFPKIQTKFLSLLISIRQASPELDVPEGVKVRLIVADNDEEPSARASVDRLRETAPFEITYVHCPKSNISIARNACLTSADADFLAFIDDDEDLRRANAQPHVHRRRI